MAVTTLAVHGSSTLTMFLIHSYRKVARIGCNLFHTKEMQSIM